MEDSTPGLTWRSQPRLRKELRIEPCSDGVFVAQLVDQRLGMRIQLDRVGRTIAGLLDGERDLGSILVALELEGMHMPPALLMKALTFFNEHLLLEGTPLPAPDTESPSPDAFKEERITLKGETGYVAELTKVYFLDEARFECIGCGMCCHGYEFLPLTRDEAARLRTDTYGEDTARLEAAAKVVARTVDEKTCDAIEVNPDGSCIFLGTDEKCIIHREKGADAKPWFCRMFPLRFLVAPDGSIFGHLQMECFSYYKARQQGAHLGSDTARLRAHVTAARDIPMLPAHSHVGKNCLISLQDYYLIEQQMLGVLGTAESGVTAGLQALGQLLRHLELGGALEDFEPRRPHRDWDSNDELIFQVMRFARGCVAALSPSLLAGKPDSSSPGMRRFFIETLDFFGGEGDISELLPVERITGPEQDPECVAILLEFLRNEVFSKEWFRCGDLRRGFGMTLTRYALTIAGSRLCAHNWGAHQVHAKALCHAMAMVLRNLRVKRLEAFLCEEDSPLIGVYEALVGTIDADQDRAQEG